MPTTKTKPPARAKTDGDTLADAIAERERLFAAVERLLFAKAAASETVDSFTSGEYLLATSLGWNRQEIATKLSHYANLHKLRQQAGSGAERSAARDTLDAARKTLETERPKLQAELDKITAELRGRIQTLERNANDAAETVTKQENAVKALRGALPSHLQHAADRQVAAIDEKFKRIGEIKSEVNAIERLAALDMQRIEDRDAATKHAESSAPGCLLPRDRSTDRPQLNRSKWREYVAGREAALPGLRDELANLEKQRDEAVAEAESNKNHYVPT